MKSRLLVVGALISIVDVVAWFTLVPGSVAPWTFVILNALVLCMFGVGLAAAANGMQTTSIAQVLFDAEHPARAARRPRPGSSTLL